MKISKDQIKQIVLQEARKELEEKLEEDWYFIHEYRRLFENLQLNTFQYIKQTLKEKGYEFSEEVGDKVVDHLHDAAMLIVDEIVRKNRD
tara:strand:+ start:221 stop:490 length:270 start_codon:yes stop_codon:yes gene_type:complete